MKAGEHNGQNVVIIVTNNQEWSPLVFVFLLSSLSELFPFTGTIKGHYTRTLYSQLNKAAFFCHYNNNKKDEDNSLRVNNDDYTSQKFSA